MWWWWCGGNCPIVIPLQVRQLYSALPWIVAIFSSYFLANFDLGGICSSQCNVRYAQINKEQGIFLEGRDLIRLVLVSQNVSANTKCKISMLKVQNRKQ